MAASTCQYCGEPFEAKRSTAKFCSEAHKKAHQRSPLAGQKALQGIRLAEGEKVYLQAFEKTRGYVPLKWTSSIPKDKFHPDHQTAARAIEKAPRPLSVQAAQILGRQLARDAIGHAW